MEQIRRPRSEMDFLKNDIRVVCDSFDLLQIRIPQISEKTWTEFNCKLLNYSDKDIHLLISDEVDSTFLKENFPYLSVGKNVTLLTKFILIILIGNCFLLSTKHQHYFLFVNARKQSFSYALLKKMHSVALMQRMTESRITRQKTICGVNVHLASFPQKFFSLTQQCRFNIRLYIFKFCGPGNIGEQTLDMLY